MNILKSYYLRNLVRKSRIKLIYFTIVYKILAMFNYSFFFYFKSLSVKFYYYRLYLLNTNFYFLFIDYIYLINYFEYLNKNSLALSVLPVKIKSYSVLRSPFVYSKSREAFSVHYHYLFFDIKSWSLSEVYFLFLNKLLYSIQLDNSKIWYKRIISL